VEYLYKDVVPDIRKLFKDHGHARILNNQEQNTENIMLAYDGKLYTLYTDYCLLEALRTYIATGCGLEYALGVCWAAQHKITFNTRKGVDIEQTIRDAINAAAEFSCGVDAHVEFLYKDYPIKKEK